MAFVAFATKKVITAQQQQQQQQGQLSRSDEQFSTTTASYQQQQDPVVTQSIAQSDLEGFHMAEAEADLRYKDGLGVDPLFCYEPPADANKEQLLEADDGGGGISQLIEHNNALRRNFDNLKHLHLQLAEANAQLQEAFLNMQAEKARVEGGIMHHSAMQHEKEVLQAELEEMKSRHAKELNKLRAEREEISEPALELGQKNRSLEKKVALMKGDNEELSQILEVVRYGDDVDRSMSTEVLSVSTWRSTLKRQFQLEKQCISSWLHSRMRRTPPLWILSRPYVDSGKAVSKFLEGLMSPWATMTNHERRSTSATKYHIWLGAMQLLYVYCTI